MIVKYGSINMPKKWIQKAIKSSKKGSLTRWARHHHLMNKDGTINIKKAEAYNEKHDAGKGRAIALAKRLRGYH
jgi:queuine/archaeosine tRNA-ribosyltransferase